MTKNLRKKIQLNLKKNLFVIKIAIYLSLYLHKGHPSYRRSLQPSKKNIQHFKQFKYSNELFSIFEGHFCPPGSEFGSGSRVPLNPDPGKDPRPQNHIKHSLNSGSPDLHTLL
jgi:hypothetical protein